MLRLSLLLAWLVALLGVVAPRVAWGAVDQRAYAGVPRLRARADYIGADGGVKVYSGVRDKTDAVPWLAQVVIIPLMGGGAAGSAAAAEAGAGGGAGAPRVLYHYTNAAERSFGRGLWSGSSVTDTASLGATEAVEQLGLKTVPDKIIPIIDRGHFIPNRPFVVQAHPLGPGGGLDFWNPRLVPPLDILPAIPIARP